jgi:hypothetical protein
MQKHKFDEIDRGKVIAEVERHFGTKLSRVGKYRKFLQDPSGKSYWVFGGYEDWHGISSEMLQEEQERASDGVLVVAKRHKSTIDIYIGALEPLIANSHDLSHTQTGDYQFNIAVRGSSITIKEVPGLTLEKLGASQEVGHAVSPKLRVAEAMLAKLSPEERTRLLAELSGRSGG